MMCAVGSHHRVSHSSQGDGGLSQEGWTRRNWASRIPYYIPILTWLPEYDWKTNIIKDAVAGILVDVG